MQNKLTEAQREMLKICLESGASWVTAPDSPSDRLLRDWAGKGWTVPDNDTPFMMPAYRITPAGRLALESINEAH